MTTYDSPALRTGTRPTVRRPLLVAAGAGVALGVADLILQLTLPYPWANLANSAAVWAVAALLLTRALRLDPARSAAAGVLALLVAVEAYYLAALAGDLADAGVLVAPSTLAWIAMGLVAGAGFGIAGAWSRDGTSWRAATGIALGVAVLLAETWQRAGDSGTALLTAALALVLLATLVRRPVLLARTTLLLLPLVPACRVLFGAAGFGG